MLWYKIWTFEHLWIQILWSVFMNDTNHQYLQTRGRNETLYMSFFVVKFVPILFFPIFAHLFNESFTKNQNKCKTRLTEFDGTAFKYMHHESYRTRILQTPHFQNSIERAITDRNNKMKKQMMPLWCIIILIKQHFLVFYSHYFVSSWFLLIFFLLRNENPFFEKISPGKFCGNFFGKFFVGKVLIGKFFRNFLSGKFWGNFFGGKLKKFFFANR